MVSNLEEVSGHIAKAERSSTACMDGILKANIAVDDTVMDPDLQCVALVKKAELVFIAVSVLGYFDEVRSHVQVELIVLISVDLIVIWEREAIM